MARKKADKEIPDWILVPVAIIVSLVIVYSFSVLIDTISPHHPIDERGWVNAKVEDGPNVDDTHGCFFLLRAGRFMNIKAQDYTFFVGEEGKPLVELDWDYRYHDGNGTPHGGDRNYTYPPTFTDEDPYWQESEYIGFDMPTKDMGIEIVDGEVYVVLIKYPPGAPAFQDTFVYTCQGNVTYM